ncbi:hypothetical protein [Nocardioides montaniterrae]
MANEVVLHIGSGKTGTSTLQRFLADHREELLAGGVLYPRAYGGVRHTHLGMAARSDEALRTTLVWRRSGHTEPAAYRAQHATALDNELAEHRPDRVLFSDEGLYALGADALAALRANLDTFAASRTVVVYLRPQDDHLVSRYQQSVKTGCVETLVEFSQRDHAHLYDYARRLGLWSDAMAPARLVVRRFEPARFEGGSLLSDFVSALDLPVEVGEETSARRNESLDAEAVELLRLLNLDGVEHHGERADAIDNRALVERLAALPRGQVLTLPVTELDRFAARWSASNAEVAQTYAGGGELFRPTTRTTGGTTTQRLAPARVEELADLVGVPRERRAGLRAIAEREALRLS